MTTAPAPTCLCIREGNPGLMLVGDHTAGGFVLTGVDTCNICNGTGLSKRARDDGFTEPSVPVSVLTATVPKSS